MVGNDWVPSLNASLRMVNTAHSGAADRDLGAFYARDGRVIVSFNPTWPDPVFGDAPHAPDHLMDGLRFQISDDEVLENPEGSG
ncbi:hypothetical protein SAMN05421505_10198 [Sinosporangium album]|uniref:Uncharacterized protein n=1 Tax=Sinosporangium album TaxID=504805 RepID=A0A1G7QRT0_9ACTN|nr:hypothetical protein [Sinosporangium album]SDG01241.1 hypothetical protein SAMN05421505_10198 [Sinosporangium album]